MKKILLFGLSILITACQSVTPEPSPTPEATATATRVTPTSEPATATPTVIPSPTATQVPPQRYFTEEFNTTPVNWSTLYASGDPSQVNILNQDGTLTFNINSQNAWVYVVYGAFKYDSVHVEASIANSNSDINSMGLVCNYDEQNGWYEFDISSDGTYSLFFGQWLADSIARYTPILHDTSKQINTGKAINEIGMDCYENIVQMYINGNLIRKMDVEYIGLTGGGKVGLSLASFEETPVTLAVDWVKISQP